MSMPFSLPTTCKIVELIHPRTTNAGFTSDAVSVKNALKAWIVIHLTQAAAHATALVPRQATDVAIGTNAVVPAVPIWANEDCAASDTLAPVTAAANYTVTADIKHKIVVFEIDPAVLTDGYDVIYFTCANSGEATNFAAAQAYLWYGNQQVTKPSAIVD